MLLTQEQQDDVNQRTKDFLAAYEKLTEEFQIDFISYPTWIPAQDGRTFTTVIHNTPLDKKYAPVKSPFIHQS